MHDFDVSSMQELLSRIGFMLKLSLGPWLSVWAIRHRAGWDYKLSGRATTLRWTVVLGGYALAASLGSPAARLVAGFTALCFLCWPNFAYHAGKALFPWPTTQARVVSVVHDGARLRISYSYSHAGQTFGGTANLKQGNLSADDCVSIAYDPLNPDESRLDSVARS